MSTFPSDANRYHAGFAAGCQFAATLLTVVPTRDLYSVRIMVDAVRTALEGRAAVEWQRAGADDPGDQS